MSHSTAIERLLADRIGLDPSAVGGHLIERGVIARMLALGLRDRDEYERVLLGAVEEVQALIEEVVIPESWFFRDARPFETLREHARAGWVVDPGRPPLTALSVPCAGGEEPYSIAMALVEVGLPTARFRVDAVDVSTRSVARAIAGVYGSNSFRGVDGAARARFFREQGGAASVDPSVRASVRFHVGNLLDPALLADRPPFDVVFCRNLLIYLDDPSRAAAYAALGRLTADGGLLFLGHADRPDDASGSPFSPLRDKGSFAYRKGPPAASGGGGSPEKKGKTAEVRGRAASGHRRPGPTVPGVRGRAVPPTPGPSPGGRVEAGGPRGGAGAPVPAPHSPGPAPGGGREAGPEAPGPAGSAGMLDEAAGLADAGRYVEAARLVDRAIAGGDASARAYFLAGMIGQAAGDLVRAEAALLKAVYLDAQHDEALLALALLARRRGDMAAESVYRRRAERVRARKGAP
jgi:chemotaxis protein methyltransferase WspC